MEPAPVDLPSEERLPIPTFTQGDDIVWPSQDRLLKNAATRSLPTRELTYVASQRDHGPTAPDNGLAVGRRLQLQAQSERVGSRPAEFPLAPVQRAAATPSAEAPAPSESNFEIVQREWADSVSSGVRNLSRAAEASSAVSTVSSAGSVAGGETAGDTDMDELAGKLYDKIRTRLKSELLVDRERAGFLTDLR
jgi:hypothetical protein